MPASNIIAVPSQETSNYMEFLSRISLNWISRDGKLIIISRGICTFSRSFIAVFIALYLEKLGFSLIQIGAFLSVSIAGSAFLTFIVSLISEKIGRKRLLIVFTLISAAAGLALIFLDNFLPLMLVAFLGGIHEQMGPAQPLEQAGLTDTASTTKRTDLFAIYRIVAVGGTAIGALAAGLPAIFQNIFMVNYENFERFELLDCICDYRYHHLS